MMPTPAGRPLGERRRRVALALAATTAASAAYLHAGATSFSTVPGSVRLSRDVRPSVSAASQRLSQEQAQETGSTLAAPAATLCGLAIGVQAARAQRTARAGKKKGKKQKDESGYKATVLLPETDFSQRAMAKMREPELQAFWNSEGVYEQLRDSENPMGTFSLHDGPPYANGSLHMGHALNKILKDSINKFKSMQGYKVKYIPGWDCHGLPIELKVLQSMKSKERKDLTPLKLRQKAAEFARETVQEQRESFERYGVWGEFENPYLTLLPKYEAAQLGIFEEMVRGGHIYRGRKPVYWSPSTRTALAEAELEYPENHVSPSIYVAFKCTGEATEGLKEAGVDMDGLEVAVWTTTPWTMPANRAVAVNPALDYAVVKATWPEEEGGKTRRLIVALGLVEELQELFGASMTVEAEFSGKALEGLEYEQPITGVTTPVVLGGDYITTESGTGLVHTAPGHGADDYAVGLKYDLEVAAPVDNAGNFTEEVGMPELVGLNVLKDANAKISEVLTDKGTLLLEKPYAHKYPYDWRSKKPVIFRATPQWFASIDGLRADTMEAVNKVQFIPESYANRMRPMIEGRNDWCISRQRSWGVPIPCFYHKDTEEPLLTADTVKHVKEIVAEKGTNAWFELSVEDLLPEEHKKDADQYVKGTDTMDVWFDSGSSWAAVEEEIGSPVDLYLEGQDQHRGWFQSSLITSVAVRGRAPYKAVMTHGFCVDENGRKMSKSVGNVIDPKAIIEGGDGKGGGNMKKNPPYGADTLRLWVASVDFTFDVAISDSIMASVSEALRKIRNRARFMLGNIHDFDPAEHTVAYADLPLLDRHIISQAEEVFAEITEAYTAYAFSRASKALITFMQDLSSFYLDSAKDRLYISARDDPRRRSCQTVIRWLTENLARVMAPVLCHLGEDIWQALPGEPAEKSVFLSGWWQSFPGKTDEGVETFRTCLTIKDTANLALEQARRSSMIGSALEAAATIYVPAGSDIQKALQELEASANQEVDGLKWLLGTSKAEVVEGAAPEAPEGTVVVEADAQNAEALKGVAVSVSRVTSPKCERCWVHCDTVGDNEEHPLVCQRCADVLVELGVPAPAPATAAA